ncbi:hypothetical protein A2412_02445 [Candidatus Peribacteria bacterium RIFOXYC1_FULL_58_8]|nr:MAG: hypothetical protein A2412_02445 [Candidatus Peribacteria bacterium RIFOXYC1_FULL_58_8]
MSQSVALHIAGIHCDSCIKLIRRELDDLKGIREVTIDTSGAAHIAFDAPLTLDAILEAYVEDSRSIAEIIAAGFEEATVRRVAGLVRRSEYKRRQAPPGPKVTRCAFGRERRYPLTAVYGDM